MAEAGSSSPLSSPPPSPSVTPSPLPCPPHVHSPPPASIPAEPPFLLPPGYIFSPRDGEMVSFLWRKLSGLPLTRGLQLCDVDVSLFEPEQLPRNKQLHREDASFFFTTRTPEDVDGAQASRPTPNGCWKGSGKVREITHGDRVVGYKKMFVYYQGKAPDEVMTFWMMKQVSLNPQLEKQPNCDPQMMDGCVMCKVYSYIEETRCEDDETTDEDE